jgi:hypothetical protein
MPVAFATGRLPGMFGVADVLATARSLDVRAVFFSAPVERAASWLAELKASGIQVCGVAPQGTAGAADETPSRFEAELGAAATCASHLKAGAVVVEGGEVGGVSEADREAVREPAAERAVRALHAGLRGGVPLAIRPGGRPRDLLGFEETGWLLSELPALGLWLDPARAVRAHRRGCGSALEAWVDAYAGRCGGLFVQGLDADLRGGVHPAEGGIDWAPLAEVLPRGVPWVLDLARETTDDVLADAVSMMRAVLE